ncbi:MAG: 16S rRNA (cytosine(967)-C(5))-methyltransferase RsmB [Lachnospiraceae bacterium]|jgi:16S rRNA (cytosine967-C5)-methyltransferase|nr:16S rRNA (cytosine(967)-C(5))-methyltransferase RsmB [Lachnospiraceae bacterium]
MTRAATGSREIILDILLEVLERERFVHDILRQALEKYQYLEKSDRAFITRTAEGTVENLLAIDQVIDQCAKVKVVKQKPVIRTILRMSVYQLLWMDRVPDRAVCSEAVKLAKGRRFGDLSGFVNGVLRNVARRREEFDFSDWSLRYSVPEWILDMWRQQYTDETVERMLQAFLADSPVTVRCNLSLAAMEQIVESLEKQGVRVSVSPLSPQVLCLEKYDYLDRLEAFRRGWICVQDPSSALVAAAAEPAFGDQVLDVCGAPGGKSLHMADKLRGTGMVTVRDLTEEKIRLVQENIDRTGAGNIQTEVWDALEFDERWEEKADIVIADLPCSGLGVIGKKPDIKYRASREKIDALISLQQQILSVVSRYVKPGGTLVYSTCTINCKENEEQRKWFLEGFPFLPENIEGRLGEAVKEDTLKDGYVQLLPGRYPCDGFFIAVFRKIKGSKK